MKTVPSTPAGIASSANGEKHVDRESSGIADGRSNRAGEQIILPPSARL